MTKNLDKKTLLAKVTLTLKNFLMEVKLIKNNQILADVECYWPKNKQGYLFHVVSKLAFKDIEQELFKQSLVYCKTHNLKFLVIAVEYDNSLFEFAMDSAENKSFKIIPYNRLSQLNNDFFQCSNNEELYSFIKDKVLKVS